MDALEEQALVPMLGTEPVELGLKGLEGRALGQLKADAVYQRLFPAAFPSEPDVYTMRNVTKAIAAFERSIISTRAPHDRYRYGGEPEALSEAAKRGEIVFASSEKGGCFQCHGGWSFGGSIRYAGGPKSHAEFHNTGLYESYPAPNEKGKFRAPTLRNIELTAPYMHDGSVATLEDAIEHYAAGGRAPNAVNKSTIIRTAFANHRRQSRPDRVSKIAHRPGTAHRPALERSVAKAPLIRFNPSTASLPST